MNSLTNATGGTVNQPDVSGIALSFDDTVLAPSWYNYHVNYGAAYGWKATFNVYNGGLTTYSSQINALYNAGHEIGNHTFDHQPINPDTYLLTKTAADYWTEKVQPLDTALQTVIPGFTRTKTFTWPYGQDIISISQYLIEQQGITMCRDTQSDGFQKFYYDGTQQVMNAYWADEGGGRDINNIKALIDVAKETNTIVLILAHNITDAPGTLNIPIAKLNAILEYVNEKNMKFYRQDELLPSLFN